MKYYTFTPRLAQELLDVLPDLFCSSNPRFYTFLLGLVNESGNIKKHDTTGRKNSKGHEEIYSLLKANGHKVEQNCTIKLEIDGRKTTCEYDVVNFAYKIIIEIQGAHHSKHVPHFQGPTLRKFNAQVKRDIEKREWAERNGWTVVFIDDKECQTMTYTKLIKIMAGEIIPKAEELYCAKHNS